MHIDVIKGDYVFNLWNENGYKDFCEKVHKLIMNGYKKIMQKDDFLNEYHYYRNKKKKKTICLTIMYP